MLEKLLSKPIELKIDGKLITFNTLGDFEFALNARTTIPLEKITEAIKSTPGELDLESNAIVIAIEKISELTEEASESGEITQNLKAINPVVFSNDHGWREIFFALKKDRSTDSSKYKQIALTAYLKYLSNRQEMIQTVKSQINKESNPDGNAEVPFRTGELEVDDNFDAKVLAKELGMVKMPVAEYVTFEMTEDHETPLLLANYQCKLINKDGIKFVDNEDNEYPMVIGLNKIGRGRECNVKFTDTMQRISRLHLMIINHDNKKVELTDLSTYGTYYLENNSCKE